MLVLMPRSENEKSKSRQYCSKGKHWSLLGDINCCKVLALIIMHSSFYSLSFGLRQRHDLAKGMLLSSTQYILRRKYFKWGSNVY